MPDHQPAVDDDGGSEEIWLTITVNGSSQSRSVDTRITLADFLRRDLALTGTHLGCEHGSCGACTVVVDGEAVRSCLMLAVQAQNTTVTTVEGLATDGVLNALQQAFHDCHALQCGFCTSGFLMSLTARLGEGPVVTEEQAREALTGNICRCTGYAGLVDAVIAASRVLYGDEAA